MNFRECKNKYPVGAIIGNFTINYEFPKTKEVIKNYLTKICFPSFFYFYNEKTKKFHRVDFISHNVEGYITVNGSNFHPFSSDEFGIYYLDHPSFENYINLKPGIADDCEIFISKIDEEWLKLYPEFKPIRTLEDLEKIEKYDF